MAAPMVTFSLKRLYRSFCVLRPHLFGGSKKRTLCRNYATKANILTLHERGVFVDIFPEASIELPKLLQSGPQCVYCGFDPTADSLHIGNLLAIIGLLHCQRAGHNTIALIGGATARIGDPSGRSKEREALDIDQLQTNIKGIETTLRQVCKNHEQDIWKSPKELPPLRIENNSSWYRQQNVVDFMSTVGRHLRMGTMLGRTSVQTRLKSAEGMSLKEFTYQMFQAYDFLHLHREYSCLIQLGGSDQMGNMMTGHDLVRKVTGKEVYAITVPLVTTTSGQKLGKTAGNAVWLSRDKTSPFELYQFFVRQPDSIMENYLKLFTFLSTAEIADIMRKHSNHPENRLAQKKLAEQVTILVHGVSGLESALRCTKALYEGGLDVLQRLTEEEMKLLFSEAPTTEMVLEPGLSLLDVLVKAKALQGEVTGWHIITDGGVWINNVRQTDPRHVVVPSLHILDNNISIVRIGKKRYHLIKWIR
ncbi:PREDICTED: tyrosine--tRNA ligase, mitochondrial-like [Branchiostoma belcheri]|uniref:Tyrosine--tRNA ligase n=1 Tax=Branchiostoma belcheri TaxID=7741 RepID=A0A6P4XN57_BRABE|nr:PREDICTED: tyrosine--tRNA ligase, mitochondrial-like [Branchiostoma belcheri]